MPSRGHSAVLSSLHLSPFHSPWNGGGEALCPQSEREGDLYGTALATHTSSADTYVSRTRARVWCLCSCGEHVPSVDPFRMLI